MAKDWRLEQLETQPYLRGVRFERKAYRAPRPEWDHDHCAACGQKLAELGFPGADAVHEGYATCADFVRGAEYEWLCVQCFQDLAEAMGWVDVTAPPTRSS